MYEVWTTVRVDEQVRELPSEAYERFAQLRQALAESPHAGSAIGSDQDGRNPARHWTFETASGYGVALYTIAYDPDFVRIYDVVWVE